VTAVASSGDGTRTQLRADQLEQAVVDGQRDWETLLVLAVPGEELWGYVPGFETTAHPVDWIWGPGPMYEALEWWRAHEHERVSDEVTALDREFFVRYRADDASPEMPRSRVVTEQLQSEERDGDWLVVVADHPFAAPQHARHARSANGLDTGWCDGCQATSFGLHAGADMALIARVVLSDHV
jgi:hypothetical protein